MYNSASNYRATEPITHSSRSRQCICRYGYIKLIALFMVSIVVTALVALHILYFTSESTTERDVNELERKTRTILLWTKRFGDKRWYQEQDTMDPTYFRDKLHCLEYNCLLTNQRNYLPSVDMYDVVMLHTAEWFEPPTKRKPSQLYVFADRESPPSTHHNINLAYHFYNMTMTYRMDSDILWIYDYILEIETGQRIAPSAEPGWRKPPEKWNDTAVWAAWPRKKKMAAWFVSHCNASSGRDELVKALQRYINVDVYGDCGPLSCGKFAKKCDNLLDYDYKFYLAFENSLCVDYLTEKVYNQLHRQIIPVVYGGANYTRYLPPHSYINVEDFPTVAKLANFLTNLAEDRGAYMRYFWWRKYYYYYENNAFCDLCAKVSTPGFRYKQQVYSDIQKWWFSGSCRNKTKIQL